MANEETIKACGQFFDGLPNDQRDGLTKDGFMREIKRLLDPDKNAALLENMVEMRRQQSHARKVKAKIDRASRNAAIGLR